MKNKEIYDALLAFRKAAINLNVEWQKMNTTGNEFTKEYPFDKSFDEIAFDIHTWVECSIKNEG